MKAIHKSVALVALLLALAPGAWAENWIDITEQYVVNPNFENGDVTTGWEGTPFGSAGPMNNAEHYSKNFATYQSISGLQPGRYRVSASAFYRMGSAEYDYMYYSSGDYADRLNALLFASSEVEDVAVPIVPCSSAALEEGLGGATSAVGGGWWAQGPTYYIPNNMVAAHYWFEAGYYHNEVEVEVGTDGNLVIGVRKEAIISSDWLCISNWRLEMWGEEVKATGLSLSATSLSLVKGETEQLTATITPENATMKTVEWSSDNTAVATVDRHGLVTAEGEGVAHIIATTVDGSGLKARCTLRVTNNSEGMQNLIVTEIMAANIDQWVDPSWNYGGWVELYNPSAQTVSLTGCWLSDDPQQLKKVHISQHTVVQGKKYKNLWFDHHDKYCLTQMDMKLDVEGDTLYLSDEAGRLVLSQEYPAAVSRCSYARKSTTENVWGWSSTPTPERDNSDMRFADVRLPAPDIDQPTQIFDASLTVCVAIPEGATLRYTTDGSTPTATNGETSDTGLFNISETTTYRFCLIGDGYLPSQVVTRSYILRDKTFDLPVLSVVGNDYDLYGEDMGILVKGNGNGRPGNGQASPCNWNMDWERSVNTEYLNTEGEMVINQETAMERCGGWSRAWAPYAFKLKANKRYELQSYLPYNFFPDKPYRKHKTLQIRNGGNDTQCRIKDPALQEIIARSGIDIDCQGYQPVMHYINGIYAGVINVREPNNKHFVYANYGLDDNEIDQFEMSPDSGYVQKCGTRESFDHWYQLAQECAQSDEVYDEIRQMVDIDEFCNYMAVQFYLGNWDWPQNNVKAFKPIMEGGRFRFVLFDLDGSMSVNTNDVFTTYAGKQTYTFDQLYGEPVNRYTKEIELVTIFLNMLKNQSFRKQFIDSYCLVAGSVFEPNRCREIINELANRVSSSQNILNELYWQRSTPWNTANSLISALSASRQQTMVNTLKNYSPMQLRTTTAQKVELSANIPQARLSVNGLPVPTNYFNGRLFAPVTFRAEAPAGYKFAGWQLVEGSAEQETTLLPTESTWDFYDQGSLDGEDWTAEDYAATDWQSGQAPLGYFVGGNRYTNTYLDYGGNTQDKRPTYYFRHELQLDKAPEEGDAFTLNYSIDDGLVIYVNGTEAGRYNMPNGTVTYNTFATEYAHGNPDTGLMTLPAALFKRGRNIIAVEVHNNEGKSSDIYWEGSITMSNTESTGTFVSTDETFEMPSGNMVLRACYEEMTPEEKQQAGMPTAPVVINEVSAGNSVYINEYGKKDDWIELYNTTDQDIDLEGMYLTDRSNKPEKCRITAQGTKASTIIPARGYKIVWCSKRPTESDLHVDFKLDNQDSAVIRLMASDRSWADSLVYCLHNGDQTVGRYPDGGSRVYLMTQPTIRKANLMNTYATEWRPEASDPDAIRPTLASRSGGLSIAYTGQSLLVKSEESPAVNVYVYTPGGALLMAQRLSSDSGHHQVGLSSLPSGLYIARAQDAQGNECTTKFAKK